MIPASGLWRLGLACCLAWATAVGAQDTAPAPPSAAGERVDVDALVRGAFVALREGRDEEASRAFGRVLKLAPDYSDAAYGLALIAERRGEAEAAKKAIRLAIRLDDQRPEFHVVLERLLLQAPELPPPQRAEHLVLDYRVSRERGFEVRGAQGFSPLFLKGINLGAALPGKFPSQFPEKPVYQAWIRDMAELGVNCVRVYTIHPPGFYEALAEHNASAEKPIYLIHGVWVEPPPGDDFGDPAWFEPWRTEMHRVVDLLHGRAALPARPGHASGLYRTDVSRWVIAYILGREWEPYNVVEFNALRPGMSDWQGRFVGIDNGHATEVFMARALEALLAYEHDTYHAQRPAAFTNWPTLDPLHHPTEATKAEENALRRRLGLPLEEGAEIREYDNDAVGLDMEKYRDGPELEAGLFASYHAYPYYPDFINLDSGYNRGRDHLGRNNYMAYLQDLVGHHRRHAVVVSEFGVPSSRLVAHWQPQGMTHGGQNEVEQGEQNARMFRNLHDAGTAGGVLFAWIDEWFKKNWLVIEFEQPGERNPLWYNPMDAEQNYGLLGAHPGKEGPNVLIDGKPDDWRGVPDYLRRGDTWLKLRADEGWLHLAIGFPADVSASSMLVGIDTHDLEAGDHLLPLPGGWRSEAGLEFVVRFEGEVARLEVDNVYDIFTHRYARPYRSRHNEDGLFVEPRTESNRARIGRDGTLFPEHRQQIGTLRRGTADRADPAFDSASEWQRGPGFIEARIPWGLLHVTDPSSLQVLRDDVPPGGIGTVTTEGFRVLLVQLDARGAPVGSLPGVVDGRVTLPPLFRWPGWEQPEFHVYRKPSFSIVQRALAALPDQPAMAPLAPEGGAE
ncbi:tetratricopeptide repeat protein [Pseudomarimonas salicorniae]|uniref:Tetratricopeptide repeat protein n=1 Tax=Pseudomarimonas salicorniae TaxID=2933270 RepID=A0ABT0GG97_9GAMM|nr:hypothetical protein [Lysobacter sp. CAU 1642]MCK7593555.1 hypothetical protein [Lysobacter sp. CAU 1642]